VSIDWRRELPACAALTAAWLMALWIVGVAGEFPIADDWAYAFTTRNLLETGRFERVGWTWAPIVSNVAVGWTWTRLFGFSFEVLRASTVFMGWVGMLGAYALCRSQQAGPAWSAVGAALVAFNPLHLALSYTFMTDVPFAAFVTWSLVFLARGLPQLRWRPLVAGSFFLALAVLSRQPALALALAAGLVTIGARLRSPRSLAFAAAVAALVTGLWTALPVLFGERDEGRLFTLSWYLREVAMARHVVYHLVYNSTTTLVYLGVFLAPLTLASWRRLPIPAIAAVAAVNLGCAVLTISRLEIELPGGIDWIYDFGIGPMIDIDPEVLPHLAPTAWWALVGVAAVSGGILVVRLALELWDRRGTPGLVAAALLLGFPLIYLGGLQLRTPFFDRYLIAVLAPLAALLAGSLQRTAPSSRAAVAAVALLPLAGFAIAGTHDHLEHHRARWTLLGQLVDAGVSSRRIDGGPAFNGSHNFSRDRTGCINPPGRPCVYDDEFRISIGDALAGYRAVASVEHGRLLPPRKARVTLFQRETRVEAP
jgi:hypothetical protein